MRIALRLEFPALVLAIGALRVRREGREAAELAHPSWDHIVRWLS